MFSKKAESLSLNVIIVAALALIVLVVLIAIFTGRITIFQNEVSDEGNAELVKMRIFYGDCQPSVSYENQFVTEYANAASAAAEEAAQNSFKEVIANCKANDNQADCQSSGCVWGQLKMVKKASADMWWIIIGAVIALVVMIILMVMFTGKTQPLEQGLSACESKGGVCVDSNGDCPKNTLSSPVFNCAVGQQCCIGSPIPADGGNCEETVFGNGKYWCK